MIAFQARLVRRMYTNKNNKLFAHAHKHSHHHSHGGHEIKRRNIFDAVTHTNLYPTKMIAQT